MTLTSDELTILRELALRERLRLARAGDHAEVRVSLYKLEGKLEALQAPGPDAVAELVAERLATLADELDTSEDRGKKYAEAAQTRPEFVDSVLVGWVGFDVRCAVVVLRRLVKILRGEA